jgi:hypothetical protein
MEGVSRIYVDELGETNDDKRLKGQLFFVCRLPLHLVS